MSDFDQKGDSQYQKALCLAERLSGGPLGQEFQIAGQPIAEVAGRVKTPFFLYSGEVLIDRIRTVKRALGDDVRLFFSLKANPSLGLCQIIEREGVGAELASIGELLIAKRAGFEPRNVIFAGPGKTEEELEAAVAWGIESVNVESAGELERCSARAAALGTRARVSLRVNPKVQLKGAQMRMGGGHTQFGIDEEMLAPVLARFAHDPNLEFVGIHVYAGSQIFDVDALLEQCSHVVEIAAQVAAKVDRPLEHIDFGGGFAVPYFEGSQDFDLALFAKGFKELMASAKARPGLDRVTPIIELGRYLVAECGVYVTRVIDVKDSRGVTYAVADGGMNHHITATGNFGQVFKKPYPMAILNRMKSEPHTSIAVVGPCCTPLDVLGQKVGLPSLHPGDLVGVFYSGAYGYSASSLLFLSHPTPAEVLALGDKLHVLREAGRADAVLLGQHGLSG